MRQRPWPIVILALCHFLAPLGNGILSAFLEGVPLSRYFPLLIQTKPLWALLDFFLLPPLAGWAIYKCRKWSYPIFLASAGVTVYANYLTWLEFPGLFSYPMFLATAFLDVGFVTYFLLPAVREVYVDPKLRWWESKPRYLVRLRGRVGTKDGSVRCTITDISEGGAFVRTTAKLELGQETKVSFGFFGRIFSTEGRVAYEAKQGKTGYGIQFNHTSESRAAIRKLTQGFKKAGVRTRNAVNRGADFVKWAQRLVTSGQGFTPEKQVSAPQQASRRKKDEDAAA